MRLDDRAADGPQNTSYKASERSEPAGPPTYGGYSPQIVVTERFTLKISTNLDPERAAPLLCAGITTFNALRNSPARPGDVVAVQGIGGLGHLGVQFARLYGKRYPGRRTIHWREGSAVCFRMSSVKVCRYRFGWARPPDFASTSMESPVHSEPVALR